MIQGKRDMYADYFGNICCQHYPILDCHATHTLEYGQSKKPKVNNTFASFENEPKRYLTSMGSSRGLNPAFIHEYIPVFKYILNSPIEEWLSPTALKPIQNQVDSNMHNSSSSIALTHNTCKNINTLPLNLNPSQKVIHPNANLLNRNNGISSCETSLLQDFVSIRSRRSSASNLSRTSSLESFCVLDDIDFAAENNLSSIGSPKQEKLHQGLCQLVQGMKLDTTTQSSPPKCNSDTNFNNNYITPNRVKKQKYNYQEWLVSQS